MERRVSIPVRVLPARDEAAPPANRSGQLHQGNRVTDEKPKAEARTSVEQRAPHEDDRQSGASDHDFSEQVDAWRDRALRLQAEMENYRKRQQQLSQGQIVSERERLLRAFLEVVDDLERALKAPTGEEEALREGLQLTHRTALQLLQKEGVEPIQAEKEAFDPHLHEAVAAVGREGTNMEADTVYQVLEQGYRIGDQLIRPAKVVVAV